MRELVVAAAALMAGCAALGQNAAPKGSIPDLSGFWERKDDLGSGSFGEVWKAEAAGGVEVAIKMIFRPLDHAASKAELRALELIKRLRHPFLLATQAYLSLEDRLVKRELAARAADTLPPGLPVRAGDVFAGPASGDARAAVITAGPQFRLVTRGAERPADGGHGRDVELAHELERHMHLVWGRPGRGWSAACHAQPVGGAHDAAQTGRVEVQGHEGPEAQAGRCLVVVHRSPVQAR